MIGCPVCGSPNVRVDLIDGSRQALCRDCDAAWEQRGSRQVAVRPGRLRGVPDRLSHGLAVIPMQG